MNKGLTNKLNKSKTLNKYTIENHNSLQQTVVSPELLKGKIGLPNEINNSEIVRQNGSCASSETDRICKDIRRQSLIQSLRFSRQMSSLNNSHNINKEM